MQFKKLISFLFVWCVLVTNSQTLNYYYGNLHSHSGYSDGNKDAGSTGVSTPAGCYAFAKLSQHFDFLGIADHNHNSSGNPGMLLSSYSLGINQAAAANEPGTFLTLYGMEWGVSSSSNGHVIIYGFNELIGWENGNYDIFNDKTDYDGLFTKVKNNPNAFCYLAHPYYTDFKNLANNSYNPSYDSAIVGVPFRNGIAFSTVTDYSDYPFSDFFDYYKKMLSVGYQIGMGYDHDNHNLTFGRNNAGRLVVLAPALTIPDLYDAMKKRHFYGSDDWNAQIDFKIGNSIMGDTTSGLNNPIINIIHNDGDGELADSIKIWSGVRGSYVYPVVLTEAKLMNTLSFTDNTILAGETKYYFAEIKQVDGQRIVTSPIWYTKGGAIGIKEQLNDFSFLLFPNPVQKSIHISTGLHTLYWIEIYDNTGKVIYKKNYNVPDVSISSITIPGGFYTLKVSSENFSKTKTLVIE